MQNNLDFQSITEMPSMLQAYKTASVLYLIISISGISRHFKEFKMFKSRGKDRDPQMLEAGFFPLQASTVKLKLHNYVRVISAV